MDWVVKHAGPDDRVLVPAEVGFLGQELERLGSRASCAGVECDRGRGPRRASRAFSSPGYLRRLEGEPIDVAALPPIRAAYLERYCIGGTATVPTPGWWRGNDQRLCVMERLPDGRPD